MSNFIALPAPFDRYSFDTETQKLHSQRGGQWHAIASRAGGYQISVKGNKIWMTQKQVIEMVKAVTPAPRQWDAPKPVIAPTTTPKATANNIPSRLTADDERRYQRLPAPFQGYVIDLMNKDLYSLISNRGNGSWNKLLPYRGATYKMWYVVANGKPNTKLTLTAIESMVREGKTENFIHEEAERDTYWVVLDTLTGKVGKEHKNVVDASAEARQISEHTGAVVHILKLVGVAQITTKALVKRVAA